MSEELERQAEALGAELDLLRNQKAKLRPIEERFDWSGSTVVFTESKSEIVSDEGDDSQMKDP